MIKQMIMKKAAKLPDPLKALGRALYYRGGHWAHPKMRHFGTVQDLYYWVADGSTDTLLLLQNYFSALYPELNTETAGSVSLYDQNGVFLGFDDFSVAHCGCAKLRVSSLLEKLEVASAIQFGTLEVNLSIPDAVLEHIQEHKPFYFWDRFYIGYTSSLGQTFFVHGVDKTHIYREAKAEPIDWYKPGQDLQWAPEIPVNILDYEKLSVIMINRTSRSSDVTLTLLDTNDASKSWVAEIPPKGVHRFQLDQEITAGLEPMELRMRVNGMATQYGRPVLFKQFPNGAMSAMHC